MSTLDPEIARAARALWSGRAATEREAAAFFQRLAGRLRATDATPIVTEMAEQAARDEVRHAGLCDGLVRELGREEPGRAEASKEAREIAPPRAPARARVFHEVVALCCVTESLSAVLLAEMMRVASDERVREVLHEVLRDEVNHARLGWAHLAAERARGGVDTAELSRALPRVLATTVPPELFSDDAEPELARELVGLGGLARPVRRDLFVATLRDVVFPGLELHGVDAAAGRAWLGAAAERGGG
jgi:hypothetical protein